MSLGRVAKKAAVATVVNRVVSNTINNRMGNSNDGGFNNMLGQQMEQQPMHGQQPVQSQQAICPNCNSGNPQHAQFCLSCGGGLATAQPVQQQQQQQQPVEQPQQSALSNCPGCKANLTGVTGNMCPYCRSAIR